MPVIKRYSNRKLYDTDSKRYVTLEDLADFVRRGEDVRVVDHVTGEDLTSVTLLQVIFEEEKKIGGLMPQVFLTRMIRMGGETMNAVRSRLVSMDPFQMVDEEIRRRIQRLVESGTVDPAEAIRWQDLLLRRASASGQADVIRIPVKGEDVSEEEVPVEAGEEPADPEQLDALLKQVEVLEEELQRLRQAGSRSPAE